MSRIRDALVMGLFFVSALLLMLLAPTDDLARTTVYVLFVEFPAVAILAFGLHAYIEWSTRR